MDLFGAIDRAYYVSPAAAFERFRSEWRQQRATFAEFQELQRRVDTLQYEIYVLRASSPAASPLMDAFFRL
jgi:hypothetical protein